MVNQLQPLPFDAQHDTSLVASAPNPKPTKSDKQGYGRLASLYTAFSCEFARYALETCIAEGHRRIADPFAGMGTIGEAGRGLPVKLLLNDLNPFASLSSVFRTSPTTDLAAAVDRIAATKIDTTIPEKSAFLQAIETHHGQVNVPPDLINGEISTLYRAAFLNTHLFTLIRISCHKRLRGSNPTWTKKSNDNPLDDLTFEEAKKDVIRASNNYINNLISLNDQFTAIVKCYNVNDLVIGINELDAIITSPPYPNRTDYFGQYLPAVELLLDGDEREERRLREAQIGTPLIRASLPEAELPREVLEVIERVRTHKSYASERYYAKGFLYYFADIQKTLERMEQWLRPNGLIILVVQDSYYKEMRIPVADLFIHIAKPFGLNLAGRKDFTVRHALSRLNTYARSVTPVRTSVESVLCLRKVSKSPSRNAAP